MGGLPVGRALKTGLFDLGFYVAQTDIEFASARFAARHYLRRGAAAGLLPHPVIDPDLAHDEARALRLARAMASGRVESHRFATRFAWTAYAAIEPTATRHPGGVVGHFATRSMSTGSRVVALDGTTAEWEPSTPRQLRRRRRWVAVITASGLFDARYYSAQLGVEFLSGRAAVWHYVTLGEAAGFSPSPLFEPQWYNRRRGSRRGSAFADYLTRGRELSPHPHFDTERYLAAHPAATAHARGPLGHFLDATTSTTTTVPFDDATPRRSWFVLRSQLFETAHRFAANTAAQRWAARRPWAPAAARAESRRIRRLPAPGPDATVAVLVDLALAGDDLADTLATVRAQTHPAAQLIAVGTRAEAKAARLGPDAQHVDVDESANHAERLAAALAEVTAAHVFPWHPGSRLHPRFFADALAVLADRDAELVSCALGTGRALDATAWGAPFDAEGLIWGDSTAITTTAVLSTRLARAVGGYRTDLPETAEWDLLLRAAPATVPAFAAVRHVTWPDAAPPEERGEVHVARSRAITDWADAASVPRVADRVSLLVPVYENWELTIDMVRATLDSVDGPDVEIVLIDNGSRRAIGALVVAVCGYDPRVHYRRMPRNTNFATGSNLALLASTGATVIFANNDTEPGGDWLAPLVAALEDPAVRGAQPLLRYPNGTVQAAGTMLMRATLPWHFLQGHPVEDVLTADVRTFDAITAAFFAARADEIIAVEGFDARYENGMEDIDLCLRLTERFGGDFRVALEAEVLHKESQTEGRFERTPYNRVLFLERWGERMPARPDRAAYQAAGLRYVSYRTVRAHRSRLARTGIVQLERPPRTVVDGPAAGLPALRWAIKIAAHGDARGDVWGDTFFAADLARALRDLGQEVVVDRRLAHVRPESDYLDDVVLALRGLEQVPVQPGATNLLWVISHPELVTERELHSGFDVAYAASAGWASAASEWSGRAVRPLLQATDPQRFHPGAVDDELAADTLFVGRTRKVFRPIVRDAIAAGADLAIFGDGWDAYLDEPGRFVRADHLDNAELPRAYRSARIVLNDHWTEMAELGFVSNRLFDAAASGSLVVSDAVAGLDELFGPLVRVYDGVDSLATLLATDAPGWPSADERRAIAERVAREHSFAARARTLLADVLDVRGIEHDLR
ncbi:glycosyltransferase [Galbitalea sp. SE-J8]|uniref:glycosyltransferase family protein n=1 Tax=Galbitalea sp. SE-J8 TaxID=3054952 RepID=UPI00259D0447|nr:glycosyltransferase [Galbitalea sp. SE-J8]MDM4762307.1 glycosyltransferase [Galbitalea sp. SE-J8]